MAVFRSTDVCMIFVLQCFCSSFKLQKENLNKLKISTKNVLAMMVRTNFPRPWEGDGGIGGRGGKNNFVSVNLFLNLKSFCESMGLLRLFEGV